MLKTDPLNGVIGELENRLHLFRCCLVNHLDETRRVCVLRCFLLQKSLRQLDRDFLNQEVPLFAKQFPKCPGRAFSGWSLRVCLCAHILLVQGLGDSQRGGIRAVVPGVCRPHLSQESVRASKPQWPSHSLDLPLGF